jgi:DNA modification methylase
MSVEIIIGDCRDRLAAMRDRSVHLVLSSPPYFGLRDYGTAEWAGGDAGCDHVKDTRHQSQGESSARAGWRNVEAQRNENFRHACGKCGALRVDLQIGLEQRPEEYIDHMVGVFREVYRVLRDDGSLWLNIGDSYANDGKWGGWTGGKHAKTLHSQPIGRLRRYTGFKPKELMGIPWKLAEALRTDGAADLKAMATLERVRDEMIDAYAGETMPDRVLAVLERLAAEYAEAKGNSWFLRQDVIWSKPNPMPESVTDRCTKSHEYLFLFTKSERYFFDAEAIAEPAIYGPDSGKFEAPKGYFEGARPQGRDRFVEQSFRAIRPTRNKRSVWTVASNGFDLEMCTACETIYPPEQHKSLRRERVTDADGKESRRVYCRCGRHDAWLSHFATFPPELIEPCILASTSAKGVCSTCAAPWLREIERKPMKVERSGRTHEKGRTRSSGTMVEPPKSRTIGWKPSCSCAASVVPATVLDPFGGAGTTGLVADRLQRDATLIELNPLYAKLARFRLDHNRGQLLDLMEATA